MLRILFLLILFASNAFCDDYALAAKETSDLLMALRKSADIPGMSVAVSLRGSKIYSSSFGMSDLENNSPVTAQTKFRIGSIMKVFTTVAVLRLAQSGKIDLDDDIRKFVPEFPAKEHAVTIRQLTSHMGGIRHYSKEEIAGFASSTKEYKDLIEALEKFKDDPLLFAPDTSAKYSSYGFVLLGAMIEKVTGKSFNSYVQTEILHNAQLNNTMPELPEPLIPGRGRYYFKTKQGFVNAQPENSSYKWSAGGYLSTAEDLCSFGSAILYGKLFDPKYLPLVLQEQKTSKGERSG
ncbi:MAG TPA: serine hydrolase domain-containing protein, partial [Acidobacteriota bacterium]|nr:serine hydrolase domain-containing protein [Acidobacteriota bacterium]